MGNPWSYPQYPKFFYSDPGFRFTRYLPYHAQQGSPEWTAMIVGAQPMVDQPPKPQGPLLKCGKCGNEFRADKGPTLYCQQCLWQMAQAAKPVPTQQRKAINKPKKDGT